MNPLADRIRPKRLAEFIGQKHILNEDKILYKAIKNGQIFSMILWGPPGVGKTTLARIIASEIEAEFLEFSAVTTSTSELKKIFEELVNKRKSQGQLFIKQKGEIVISSELSFTEPKNKPTIVFIDEIHRFNKAQQDAFLPFVESGVITLIGATTENPSFEIIGPLLSRSRVFVLNQLTREELEEVVHRALKDKESGLGSVKVTLKKDALDFLLDASNGDARQILNALEIAVTIAQFEQKGKITLSKQLIEEAYQRKSLQYDKAGEEHYNTISAFIKSMRASNIDAALYYLARMIEAGEDPLFIARRMVIFASEDIGMALPTALVVANEVFRACETIGYPECAINLAHGVVYLTSAPKDRSAYDGLRAAQADVRENGNLPIPMNLRNAPSPLMKKLGYGKDYKMYTAESLLPEKIKTKKFYNKRLV